MRLILDGSAYTVFIGLLPPRYHTVVDPRIIDEPLFKGIGTLLDKQNCSMQALSSIAVGCGPGSHTGTRAVVAAAKGLALGLNIPLHFFPSLILWLPEERGVIGVYIATKKGSFYTLIYDTETCQIVFSGDLLPLELEKQKKEIASLQERAHLSFIHLEGYLLKNSFANSMQYLSVM